MFFPDPVPVTSSTNHNDDSVSSVCKEYIHKFYPNSVQGQGEGHAKLHHQGEEDRVQFMFEHPLIRQKLDDWLHNLEARTRNNEISPLHKKPPSSTVGPEQSQTKVKVVKCQKQAQKNRQLGNKLFQQQKLIQCLEAYNESLKISPFETDEELVEVGICLANRSAVLYEMEKWTEALADIDLAMEQYSYPNNLRHKVLIRKINIFIKLKKYGAARELISKCQQDFHDSFDVMKKLIVLSKELEREREEGSSGEHDEVEDKTSESQSEPAANFKFKPNPTYVSASSALEIKYTDKTGRYIITNEKLKLGDVIYYEEPYASVLIPTYWATHCYQCHKELNSFTYFPCRSCTEISYCNQSCSMASWKESHQYECCHLGLLSSTGVAHLALRVVLVTGREEILGTVSRLREKGELEGDKVSMNPSVHHPSEPAYLRVYSLVDHLSDMAPEDAFQYTLTASFLTHYLRMKTSFFLSSTEEQEKTDKAVYIVGGAMLRHVCQLICNANALSSIESPESEIIDSSRVTEFSQVRIASAIYPSASLMNHSCSPNILSVFKNGRTLTVKVAVSSLPPGSQLFNCYGPHFRRMNYKERQDNLKQQYFFNCECAECEREKGEKFSFADKFSAFKCTGCEGPVLPDYNHQRFESNCLSCGKLINLKTPMELALMTDQLFSKGMEFVEQGDLREALVKFINCYNLREKILYPFHVDIGTFSDCLAKYYSILGNYPEALKFTQRSLEYVQERFGGESIEWAREYRKYLEVKKFAEGEEGEGGVGGGAADFGAPATTAAAENKLIDKAQKIITLYSNF